MLTLDYRPKRFADVLGQAHVVPVLQAMVSKDQCPAALLFNGSYGTGKTSLARVLAAALNCTESGDDACGQCDSCRAVQNGGHDAVLEIDGASHGGVESVTQLRQTCAYVLTDPWRVVILDEVQAMSREAHQALLKLLEEPPPRTVFVLLTTDPQKITATVRSRAMPFEFRPVLPDDVTGRLHAVAAAEGYDMSPELFQALSAASGGHVRDALMRLEQCALADVTTVSEFRELFGQVSVAHPLLQAAAQGQMTKVLGLTEEFFLGAADTARFTGDLIQTLLGTARGEHPDLEALIPNDAIYRVLHLLWDAQERPQTRQTADLTAAMLVKVLSWQPSPQGETMVPAVEETDDVMSADDVLAFLTTQGMLEEG